MHIKNDNNLKVVTIRILSFLSAWLYSSITESCMQSFKEDSCSKHRKLVTGNEAAVHLVERDCKFAMLWSPDQESVPIMPA